MGNNKKRLIIIIVIVLAIVLIAVAGVILYLNRQSDFQSVSEESGKEEEKDLENDFKRAFYNVNYEKDTDENLIGLSFSFNEQEENKYDIRVNVPKINVETDVTQTINEDIVNTFGSLIVEIGKLEDEFALYTLDYIYYVNGNFLSLIVKGTLKEGSNPQRVILKTYNYDLTNDRIVTLNDIIKQKNINKDSLESKILSTVRNNNKNAKTVADQGYNIYVRDIRSDEYLVDNIENFFLGEDANLYIVFAYGNKNYTETMDIITW